ncbi:MAG TPA: L-histidine N(alpha)-methyltransferase [Ignavibacteriaceae bacterium]
MYYTTNKENEIIKEVIQGLTKPGKELPSKLFYDNRGSSLFDEITALDEYYITRTEMRILEDNIVEIGGLLGEGTALIELGSGSSKKIRLLIDNIPGLAAYIPIDISGDHLIQSAADLSSDYPELEIVPMIADYTKEFGLPVINKPYDHFAAFYPGSTIGNFKPEEAKFFLHRIAALLGKNGGMIIGVDLKKDKDTLEAAYNDSKGITAEFNLNILNHINNATGSDFIPDNFQHNAFYNTFYGRIEMHLVSKLNQRIRMNGSIIDLKKDDDILTEYSYKYTLSEFEDLIGGFFEVRKIWTDKDKLYSVQYLRVK